MFLFLEDKLAIVPAYDVAPALCQRSWPASRRRASRRSATGGAARARRGGQAPESKRRLLMLEIPMLRDPEFAARVSRAVPQRRVGGRWRWWPRITARLADSGDAYLQERTTDIHDVASA